jgi:hypothetical protein
MQRIEQDHPLRAKVITIIAIIACSTGKAP